MSTSPSETPNPGGLADLTYEQARDALSHVVRQLEAGGTTLEESLTLWERGDELARICQQRLDGVRQRIAERLPQDGATSTGDGEAPF